MTISENYKFYIEIPGLGNVEAFPVNDKLSWEWKKEDKQHFLRKDLTTKLIFMNNAKLSIQDFNRLYQLERAKDRCNKIKVTIQAKCDTAFQEVYRGFATVLDGDWDVSFCRVDIKFTPDDPYTCIFDNWEKEINILNRTETQNVEIFQGSIELSPLCTAREDFLGPNDYDRYSQAIASDCIDLAEGWVVFEHHHYWTSNNNPSNPEDGYWTISTQWMREKVNDTAPPGGYGWIAVSGGYARPVAKKLTFENIGYGVFRRKYEPLFPTGIGIDNGRFLNDVLEMFFSEYCGFTLVSNFFGINADSTNPTNEAYTKAAEVLQEIMIFHKGDIVRHDASENNIYLNLTLKKLLEQLIIMFNLKYEIIDDKIYLEHWSYFLPNLRLDLTTEKYEYVLDGNWKYNYLKEEVPRFERFLWEETTDLSDFDGIAIRYENECFSRTNPDKTYPADKVTTNIEAMLANDDLDSWTISENSFVLIATSGGYVVQDLGLLSLTPRLNAPLAWSNLQFYFYKHGRYFSRGFINNIQEEFFDIKKLRKQVPLKVRMCCSEMQNFNPSRMVVKTQLGFGEIQQANYIDPPGELTLNLIFE